MSRSLTPYEAKTQRLDAAAAALGYVKYQVSGLAPYQPKERTEEQKQRQAVNTFGKIFLSNMITSGSFETLFGLNPADYADELGKALNRDDDDDDDANGDDGDDGDEGPSAKTLQYFNSQSIEDIEKMKFILVPEFVLDRADKLRDALCKCGQRVGKAYNFVGSREDSRKMIFKISDWMHKCDDLFKTSKPLALFELVAITVAIFDVAWWLQDTWHVNKYTRVTISSSLSYFWKRALSPETCHEAKIDSENRDAFVTFLSEINSKWKDYSIDIRCDASEDDMEEDEDEDAQHSGEMSDMSELFDFN